MFGRTKPPTIPTYAERAPRAAPPGTEVRLESAAGQHVGNVYLSSHVDEYPDVVMVGHAAYFLAHRGDGPELALYQEHVDWKLAGTIERLPSDSLLPPRTRLDDEST